MAAKRWVLAALGLALMAVVVAAAVLGCGEESRRGPQPAVGKEAREETETAQLGSEEWKPPPAEAWDAREDYASGEATGAAPAPVGFPQLQLKVIKNALVEMEVARGEYAKVRENATAAASAAGGYVEGESASRDDEGLTYATLTLRVPADKFDQVVTEVSSLGEVISTQVSTNDVSGEYVDLESRLRHLQAQEAFYLSLIAKAQNVQEMITIREHLDSIQLEKEQVQGRMNFLDQQVGFSTLTLSVDETAPDEGKGFWEAVGEAFKSFGRGLKALAIGLFYALPYALAAAVIAAVVWLLVRRRRRTPGDASAQ